MILVYISNQVIHSNSLEALNHIGYYNYYTTYLVLMARTIDLTNKLQLPSFYSVAEVGQKYALFEDKKIEMITDYNKWTYCPSYKIFTEPEIVIWGNSTKNSTYYENFVNIIGKTDRAVIFM